LEEKKSKQKKEFGENLFYVILEVLYVGIEITISHINIDQTYQYKWTSANYLQGDGKNKDETNVNNVKDFFSDEMVFL